MRTLISLTCALSAVLAQPVICAEEQATLTVRTPAGKDESLQLPSASLGQLTFNGKLYVAMGAAGVAVYDLSVSPPKLLETKVFDAAATGVVMVNGAPWVTLQATYARPLAQSIGPVAATASGTPAEGPTTPAPAPVRTPAGGSVVETSSGAAVLDRGLEQGLAVGDMVRILTREAVGGEGGGEPLYREVEAGAGVIEAISGSRARVTLARGVHARVGDRFEKTTELTHLPVLAPPRVEGVRELSLNLRPFLAVGNLGLGVISQASFAYYAPKDYFVEVRLDPASLGLSARDGNLLGVSALALGGYDHRFFGIGLGLGGTLSNSDATRVAIGYYDGETGAPTGVPAFENVRQGLSVAQVARLGTRDGLNLEIRNTFVLGTVEEYTGGCYVNEQGEYVCEDEVLVDTYKEFRWGSTTGTLTAPVARVTDLLVTVGGGSTGYFNVMGGMQSWMRGNGDAPSLGISVAAGYGMIAGSPTEDTYLELRGPLVSVGLRSRW